MAAVSFFIPLVGFLYSMAKKESDPEESARCLRWAEIGFFVEMVITVFFK